MAEYSVFKGRHFDRSVILLCVRWYLAYNLSLRNLEEMMAERGISVDHATVHSWTVHYAPLLLERFIDGSEPLPKVARRRDIHQGERSLGVSLPGYRQQRRHG